MKKLLPKFSKNPQGFTLVELLVVVAIIAILAVIGFVVLGNVTARARDARRKADIDTITKAYEVNYEPGTGLYQALADNQFTAGKIPRPPESPTTGSYICVKGPTQPNPQCTTISTTEFLVCANLEGGTNCTTTGTTCYCKSAAQGGTAVAAGGAGGGGGAGGTSTITAGCADGTVEQNYATNMVGCNGSVSSANKNSLCASGSQACTFAQYRARGGANAPSTSLRWLADLSGTTLTCSSNLCGGTTCLVVSPSGTQGLCAGTGLQGYATTCSITSNDVAYLTACGNDPGSNHGTTCCSP